ncbi:flagellar transcriptional regulator FlhD [Marinobacter alkaliphilus]|uniref:Flagellar transcriptional regulator FlhD n=1 Tax=Marinobacter alkaliphilus TaxID=254719 RepID=A0ABZ3E969_9GAMM
MSEIVSPDVEKAEKILRNIQSVNFLTLMLASEVAEFNPTQAEIQFGVSPEVAEQLAVMGRAELAKLAQMPAALFVPRCSGELLSAAMEAASEGDHPALDALHQLMVTI